jgi:hypothetical protein
MEASDESLRDKVEKRISPTYAAAMGKTEEQWGKKVEHDNTLSWRCTNAQTGSKQAPEAEAGSPNSPEFQYRR